MAADRLGVGAAEIEDGVPLDAAELRAARIKAPAHLAALLTDDSVERAGHTYGKAYRDIVRAFRGRYDNPPDLVAHPRDEGDIEAILEWAEGAGAAVIPSGG